MKAKEIEQLILKGEPLEIVFGARKNYYSVGYQRIPEKQFDAAREKFKDRLDFKMDCKGFTRHIYTIKKGEGL